MKHVAFTLLVLTMALPIVVSGQAARTARSADEHHLMPVPAGVKFGSGRLSLSGPFTVASTGHTDARLTAAIDRAVRRLEGRTGREYPRGLAADADSATLVVKVAGPGKPIPAVDEDESYSLVVSDRQSVLSAPTVVGAIRGLETLLQLVDADREGYFVPSVSIDDRPRFRWRGLLIDSSRHFQPLEVIKRNLDAMAAVKLNVLHWHLSDDQGFRVESRSFPKLHTLGSDGLFYTQEQIREIVAYARDRGIRVLPEFDMPGHATSWLVAHPELGSAPGPYTIERNPGIFDSTLDPTREEVYQFLDRFLGEMAQLFPDAYLHIGGDENTGKQWSANPRIQAFMKEKGIKDNHALQAYFNRRLLEIVTRHGKRMMGWDEILHPDLPRSIVIHSWRGPESLAQAARLGYDGVLSNGYYIDLIYPASKHYANDPIPAGSTLTPEQEAHILGGEATMWGEWVSPETIDSRIWPRTAAIAERLWSPRHVQDVDDMYRRLAVVSRQLEELGLTHEKNLPMLLRRLARSSEIEPLLAFVTAVEPVKEYRRYELKPATMLAPLTSLVDAARPDSEHARAFAAHVDGLLSDAPRFGVHREPVAGALSRWRELQPAYDVLAARSPALQEHAPLATSLSEVGTAGLEALEYLTARTAPPAGWAEARLAQLEKAAEPKVALEIVVVPSVRKLVVAAAELPALDALGPAAWTARVKERVAAEAARKSAPPPSGGAGH